jgi:hypothetical protein
MYRSKAMVHLSPRVGDQDTKIALVTFPGAMPELSVDPGDSGDEAVGLDGAKNHPCLGSI